MNNDLRPTDIKRISKMPNDSKELARQIEQVVEKKKGRPR